MAPRGLPDPDRDPGCGRAPGHRPASVHPRCGGGIPLRRPPILLLFVLLAIQPLGVDAAHATDPGEKERPTAGGRAAWVFSDELDLVGDVWADLPLIAGPRDSLYFGVDSRVTIEKATDGLTFRLGHLEYQMELGWRGRHRWTGRRPLSVYLGQRGQERIDADGQAYVQYLGLGIESHAYRRNAPGPFRWKVSAGPVLEEREVRADAVLRGEARYWWSAGTGRLPALGFDLELDGLVDGGRLDADVAAGPRLGIPLAGGRTASFFLHYLRSRNPLGLGEDSWMLGFAYEEGDGEGLPAPPEVDGLAAVGGGEGRLSGRLLLRVLSPPFAGRTRVVFLVDGNILTADDTGELYYLYHLGIERPVAGRTLGGVYFYHRSNHRLAEPGDRITSINVLEAGVETDDWRRVGRSASHLAAFARVGLLLDSDFGEDRFWHARGGVRWWFLPVVRGPSPYLQVELEAGDVERESFAVGFSPAQSLDLQLEYRNDDQYFGRDRTTWLLVAAYGF